MRVRSRESWSCIVGMGPRVAPVVALLLVVGAPPQVSAQDSDPEWTAPTWVGDATFLGVNTLFGALTAGVQQRLEGGSFRDGFATGAFGGAIAFTGRRISVGRYWGAGLLGRQVSAVGVSVVRNAADGRGMFDQFIVPVGPVRLYVDRSEEVRVQPKVALGDLAWLVGVAARPETRLDGSASMSAGAPVFLAPGRAVKSGGEPVRGKSGFGSIILSDLEPSQHRITFAHERVHVLQHDFSFALWSKPLEERLIDRSDRLKRLNRYVEVGVLYPFLRSMAESVFDVTSRNTLVELEAVFLSERGR
jgi:hypothetical protein